MRHRRLYSAGSALCMLCSEQEEDCGSSNVLLLVMIWANQGLSDITNFLGHNTEVETTKQIGEKDLRW